MSHHLIFYLFFWGVGGGCFLFEKPRTVRTHDTHCLLIGLADVCILHLKSPLSPKYLQLFFFPIPLTWLFSGIFSVARNKAGCFSRLGDVYIYFTYFCLFVRKDQVYSLAPSQLSVVALRFRF